MGEWSHLDLKRVAGEVDQLRAELDADLGPADVRHLRRVERWGRFWTALGYATAWVCPNPLSAFALSFGVFIRWAVLAHHTLHALGSKALGFSQELFDPTKGGDAAQQSGADLAAMAEAFPHLMAMMAEVAHDDPDSTLGWCDDQSEFEFGLDVLLDGMVDAVVTELSDEVGPGGGSAAEKDWAAALRTRVLTARTVMLRHPWLPSVLETRTSLSLPLIGYYEGVLATLRAGGFSNDLAHHTLHALGSKALGFSQELFDPTKGGDAAQRAGADLSAMAAAFPNLMAMMAEVAHDDPDSTLGWCDDQSEFEFGLDVLLDGLERRRAASA